MRRFQMDQPVSRLVVVLFCAVSSLAQVPGRNINMVSGTQFPGGDPYLQRQNEPSMAVSTRNPQHLFAGANDYRSVDIPIPPDSGVETGDAWMGVFSSLDGGQTWNSTLLPGYPQDQSSIGLASPLHAFSVATDPTVRAGTHGLFYYSGLVFNRGTNAPSGVFVSTFQDQNNKGNGSPITYLNTTMLDTGTSGQFIDKPWIAVDVPRPGTSIGVANCTINGKSFFSGKAYVFYTLFNGSNQNPSSSIKVSSSSNCGRTWSKPIKISQALKLNQGTVAAIDPGTGTVYVAWRQLNSGNQADAMQVSVSTDGGISFLTTTAYTFPMGLNFDQTGSAGSFRENDLPALTVDGSGRVWLAFSQRNKGPLGTSRIMMTTKTRTGTAWSTPYIADTNASAPGHQFMPSLSYAYGKVFLSFYDNRDDNTSGRLQCPANATCNKTSDLVEVRVPVAGSDLALGNLAKLFGSSISDAGAKIRHTIDVRGALVDPTKYTANQNPPLAFPSFRISQYKYGSRPGSSIIEQMQFNPPNFPMFVHGTRSFIGDYIDVAALTMVPGPNNTWTFNTQASNAAVFHTTWTDNRDVRPPPVTCTGNPQICTQDWSLYTPVASTGGTSGYDPTQPKPQCAVGQTGSRNQNVYTARITQGLLVGLKENSKSLLNGSNAPIQRAFSVFATNTTGQTAFYRLTINPPPAGTSASFDQKLSVPSLDVTILPTTTISRSVFVTSSSANPTVSVTVAEIVAIGGAVKTGGLQSTVLINPDPTNPKSTNPDIITFDATNPDITTPYSTNPDITNAEVYDPTVTNPDITNPDITNPDITNPDITNPDITNPDITNPDITAQVVTNPDITNPDITNPDITNPDITNPDITNPDITNPDITNLNDGGITDFTYKVTNKGNTSSSYNAKQFAKQLGVQCCPVGCPGGTGCPNSCSKCQLIARKTYPTPIANACKLTVEVQNIPISNIPNPVFTTQGDAGSPDNSSDPSNATVSLAPGEGGRVTLRVFGPLVGGNNPGAPIKTIAVAGGANTGQQFAAASLAIVTVQLPVGVVGAVYGSPLPEGGTGTKLQSVGGVGPKTWSETGSLPGGLTLSSAGTISGTVTAAPSPYFFTAQVKDSIPNTDFQQLELDVNKLSIANVSADNTNTHSIYLKAGDSATVRVLVSNEGPANASSVMASPLGITSVAAGTPPGPSPSVSCSAATPVSASVLSNSTQEFDYNCTNASGNGFITFSATASGHYVNSAADVTAAASAVTSSQIIVDTTPPTLSFAAASPAPNGAGWNNTNVSYSYTTNDNLSGVASGVPASALIIGTEGKNLTTSATVTDKAGNAATFTTSPGVNIDKTPPVISRTVSPAPNANGWNNTAVAVTFTCVDNPALIASGVGSLTSPATLTTEGANQSAAGTCTDVAGNSSNTSATSINIDFTQPSAAIITPPNGATYVINQPVPADYTCGDALSGIFACTGTVLKGANIPTGSVGQSVFSLTPTDKASNAALASTTYSVHYTFKGFQAPLATAGTPTEPSNSGGFALGSKLPLGWQLSDYGEHFITDTSAISSLQAVLNPSCSGAPPDGTLPIPLIADGVAKRTGDTFVYDTTSHSFVFTLDTNTLATGGCYNLVLTLADGHSYSTIVHLTFSGFSVPLKMAGTTAEPSDSGSFAVRSTVPVRWKFEDNSGVLVNTDSTFTINSINAFFNPICTGGASADAAAINLFIGGAPVGTNTIAFQPDGTYEFDWDTSTLVSGGCYNLVIAINDGYSYSTIVHLSFNGFQQPLKGAGTTSTPTDSGSFALGGGLRIPWQFVDGSGNVVLTDQTATITSVEAFLNAACAGAPSTDTVPISLFANGAPTGSNVMSFQADGTYQLTWDTSSLPGEGCYNLVLNTGDGSAFATIVHLVIPSFDGFLSPLAVAGSASEPSDSGTISMGNPIPVKWRFNDGGGNLITSNLQGILQSIVVIANSHCAGSADGAASTPLFSGGTPAAGDTYTFDKPSSTYIFTWQPALDPGCYNLVLGLTDGTSHATIINLN